MHSIVDHLIHQAGSRPDAPAVECQDKSISYGELHRMSSAIAATLLAGGVAPGGRVALWLRKSIESIVAIYGILKAGAAYVPIDPSVPRDRARRIFADCDVAGVVAHGGEVEWLCEVLRSASPGACVVSVGAGTARNGASTACGAVGVVDWQDALRTPAGPPAGAAGSHPRRPAYILYTSGSKGVPKGVALSHVNALVFVEWAVAEFGLRSDDRFASHAPLHFDLSVLDVFASCHVGGTLVLVPESHVGLGGALNKFVADRAVTVWYSVPNALTRMVTAGNSTLLTSSALRTVLFAGETFPISRLRQLRALLPSADLYNLYGPTETNVCTYHRVGDADLAPELTVPVPIGRPCPYATAYLVDAYGHPLKWKPGQLGELCVGGSSVMLAYWRDEELTSARSVRIPQEDGTVVAAYRTGDVVRLDDDLNLVFCGREDDMVKIRGHRVELGDVESVLSTVSEVGEIACVAVGGEDEEKRLEAYVVPGRPSCDVAVLRRHCAAALPRYMMPARFHLVPTLPRTPTGKIDRRSLVEAARRAAGDTP
jgi:amino acid adenylation domain-containing protein